MCEIRWNYLRPLQYGDKVNYSFSDGTKANATFVTRLPNGSALVRVMLPMTDEEKKLFGEFADMKSLDFWANVYTIEPDQLKWLGRGWISDDAVRHPYKWVKRNRVAPKRGRGRPTAKTLTLGDIMRRGTYGMHI